MTNCLECGTPLARTSAYCPACEWMTQPEAAQKLRVSRPTYYRLVRAGQLHPRRVGKGKVLVERAEVERILRGRKL